MTVTQISASFFDIIALIRFHFKSTMRQLNLVLMSEDCLVPFNSLVCDQQHVRVAIHLTITRGECRRMLQPVIDFHFKSTSYLQEN